MVGILEIGDLNAFGQKGTSMQPEVIANLWTFYGAFLNGQLIYQVALRLYAATGSDDEKLAILRALAAWDFHLAEVFPPSCGRTVIAGFGDGHTIELKGVMFANAADMNGMDRYQGAFDSVRNNPRPEHIIGGVVRRAPVDLTNLLNVTTPIDVDASGNMVARTSDPQLARSKPIAAVNLWAFGGRGNTQVEAVGGRAYLLAGKQPDRDKIMNNLAANDYLLSHRIAVPGKPDISVAASQGDSLFVPALEKMERDIPDKFVDWEKKKTHRYPLSRADLERRVSLVREDGAISPLAVPKRTGSSGGFFKRLLGR